MPHCSNLFTVVFIGKDLSRGRNYSEEVAAAIDKEIRTIIADCYDRALAILEANKGKLELITNKLLEQETINRAEFEELMIL